MGLGGCLYPHLIASGQFCIFNANSKKKNMSRSVILILLFLNSFIGSAQNNCEVVWPSEPIITGLNSTYLIYDDTEITFNGEPLINGVLGAFYTDDNGNLQNGGWVTLNNTPINLTVWANDETTDEKDGFASGEEIIWLLQWMMVKQLTGHLLLI